MTTQTREGTLLAGDELHGGSSCTASRHGDETAYDSFHCRCPTSREAHRISRGRRHLRLLRAGPALVPGVGTARRLQALAAIGYSTDDLAAGLDMRPSYVGQLQHAEGRRVRRVTAEKVSDFYQRHADHRGPSPRTVHYARRSRWLPPLWWDDDTIDDPTHDPQTSLFDDNVEVMDGCQKHRSSTLVDPVSVDRACDLGQPLPPLNRAEKVCAYKEMDRRRVPRNEIARRLRISGATARIFADAVGDRADDARMSEAVS